MKYKVQILFSKIIEVEASDKEEARSKASEVASKDLGVTFQGALFDRFIIQEPKDLSKPEKPAKEAKKK